MRRLVWARAAHADFIETVAYIARDKPEAARDVARRIDQVVRALAEMPTGRRGRVAGTYERVVFGLPYIVAYALGTDPDGTETITILRVIHGARDWRAGGWPE